MILVNIAPALLFGVSPYPTSSVAAGSRSQAYCSETLPHPRLGVNQPTNTSRSTTVDRSLRRLSLTVGRSLGVARSFSVSGSIFDPPRVTDSFSGVDAPGGL